jgi:hypothetical protein
LTVTPTTAEFDKASPANLAFTVASNIAGTKITGIKEGTTVWVKTTDYNLSENDLKVTLLATGKLGDLTADDEPYLITIVTTLGELTVEITVVDNS